MGISRKYVDLIHKASGKYGNWDPPYTVEVGDWGKVDRETGKFVREGNIFKDAECRAALSDLPSDMKLIGRGNSEDVLRVTINAQPECEGDLYTEIGGTGALAVRVSGAWKFSAKQRAAILTMTDSYSYYLEAGVIFPKLKTLPKLNGKALVTETLHCPAYALLLTEKGQGGKASLTLHAGLHQMPTGTTAGANMGWNHNTESGFWRTACGYRTALDEEDAVFTPLYRLERLSWGWRTRYRGGPASGSTPEEPVREDYPPPWEELDEDGEEVPEDSPMSPEF
ncbi:hypothetical protein OPQ81_011434 [Rhizoctonia solani]|nr:hypothetical protein OPQ81_011434 [Rhizoctonia solani]